MAFRGFWHGRSSNKITSYANTDKPVCQLCFKKSYTIYNFYKRFDSTFKTPPPRPSSKQQFNQYQPQSQPRALIVQPSQVLPDAWYLDTGASAHVTHDINDFTSHTPYTGADLLVCNNLEVNNTINWLYKALFMNWIFKRYFVSLSIIEFMNHSEFMTGIVKLHNIEYTLKSH
jgi:hypothetical protein